jgi:hypothetical protein
MTSGLNRILDRLAKAVTEVAENLNRTENLNKNVWG